MFLSLSVCSVGASYKANRIISELSKNEVTPLIEFSLGIITKDTGVISNRILSVLVYTDPSRAKQRTGALFENVSRTLYYSGGKFCFPRGLTSDLVESGGGFEPVVLGL